jgi:hypothetical protein
MTEARLRIYQAESKILDILIHSHSTNENRRLSRQEVFVTSGLDEELFHTAYVDRRRLGYVMAPASDHDMWITAEGMKFYFSERAQSTLRSYSAGLENLRCSLQEPNPPSSPSNNVIYNNGYISNLQIQQGTTHSSQSGSLASISIEELSRLLKELRASLPRLALSTDNEAEAEAAVAGIEAQLCSPTPNKGLVRESLGSLRRIFEGVASSALGSGLAQKIAQVISDMGTS